MLIVSKQLSGKSFKAKPNKNKLISVEINCVEELKKLDEDKKVEEFEEY